MTIREVRHFPEYKIKQATVTLSYEEIRDIANGLFKANQKSKTHRDFFFLFELVKNGCIDFYTAEHYLQLNKEVK